MAPAEHQHHRSGDCPYGEHSGFQERLTRTEQDVQLLFTKMDRNVSKMVGWIIGGMGSIIALAVTVLAGIFLHVVKLGL